MGNYLNPPEKIKEVGRPISGSNYNDLTRQLRAGEILVGLFDRGIFKIAPHLYSPEEFDEFDRQYMSGMLISRYFFAASEAVFKAHNPFQK